MYDKDDDKQDELKISEERSVAEIQVKLELDEQDKLLNQDAITDFDKNELEDAVLSGNHEDLSDAVDAASITHDNVESPAEKADNTDIHGNSTEETAQEKAQREEQEREQFEDTMEMMLAGIGAVLASAGVELAGNVSPMDELKPTVTPNLVQQTGQGMFV